MGFFFSKSRLSQTVLIIGGGPAGTKLAHSLDSKASVILVEKRETYVHCVGGLRALVNPSSEANVVIPYDSLLKNGRFIVGEVVEIKLEGANGMWTAVLASGEVLKVDVIVLATGSGQAQLGRTGNVLSSPTDIKGYFKSVQEKVSSASSIVVVGGGPIGVEMVGELNHYHPSKNVTLVHNGAALVSNPNSMANAKFQSTVLSIVTSSGVKVLLNDSVDRSLFKDDDSWIVEGPLTVTTSKGVTLSNVDLVFKAVGVPKPSGRLLSSSCFVKGKQLDKDGYFIVDEHYQVSGLPKLFALGDCLTYPSEAKTIVAIMFRLGAVVSNVVRACKNEALKGAIQRQTWSAMVVPFGPTNGAGYAGSWGLPKFMVVSAKSKNLFVPETWKDMGCKLK